MIIRFSGVHDNACSWAEEKEAELIVDTDKHNFSVVTYGNTTTIYLNVLNTPPSHGYILDIKASTFKAEILKEEK